jgi:hypothetical protein
MRHALEDLRVHSDRALIRSSVTPFAALRRNSRTGQPHILFSRSREADRSLAFIGMSLGAHFERSVRGVFGFLVREHSFAEPRVSRRGYQYTVLDYVKGSVAIQANFDMEEAILVTIAVGDGQSDPANPFTARFRFAIDALAVHRDPSWVAPPQQGIGQWTDEHIDRVVNAYGRALRAYGSDVLAGDTSGLLGFLALHPNTRGQSTGAFVGEWQRRQPRGRAGIARFIRGWKARNEE